MPPIDLEVPLTDQEGEIRERVREFAGRRWGRRKALHRLVKSGRCDCARLGALGVDQEVLESGIVCTAPDIIGADWLGHECPLEVLMCGARASMIEEEGNEALSLVGAAEV